MLASSRDIRVYSQTCASDICFDNCGKQVGKFISIKCYKNVDGTQLNSSFFFSAKQLISFF